MSAADFSSFAYLFWVAPNYGMNNNDDENDKRRKYHGNTKKNSYAKPSYIYMNLDLHSQ